MGAPRVVFLKDAHTETDQDPQSELLFRLEKLSESLENSLIGSPRPTLASEEKTKKENSGAIPKAARTPKKSSKETARSRLIGIAF